MLRRVERIDAKILPFFLQRLTVINMFIFGIAGVTTLLALPTLCSWPRATSSCYHHPGECSNNSLSLPGAYNCCLAIGPEGKKNKLALVQPPVELAMVHELQHFISFSLTLIFFISTWVFFNMLSRDLKQINKNNFFLQI